MKTIARTKMKKTVYLLVLFSLVILSKQSLGEVIWMGGMYEPDTVNKVDNNNSKQGHWIYLGKDKKLLGYAPDQKIEEGDYRNNRKTGTWTRYFPNGNLQSKITYKNGRPNGYAKVYYKNGTLREEGFWKRNKWVGKYKYYHENGKIYYEFIFNKRGVRSGVQKYYYDNGKLMIEGAWKKGERKEIKKYPCNAPAYAESAMVGAKDGSKRCCTDPNATPVRTSRGSAPNEKSERKMTVKVIAIEEGEVTRSIQPFADNGYHRLYNKEGQLSKEGEFENGKLITGKWYRYSVDGVLHRTDVYKNGVYIGKPLME